MIRSTAVGVTVLAISLMRSLADGIGLTDESWFLQVVSRLRSGDVLYRDVYFGATPLSVYVTVALTRLAGIEIFIVKLVTNAAFALTVVLADRLVRRAGVSRSGSWVLMGALLLWARPYANPPYTSLAMMLFMATLAASLAVVGRGRPDASPQPITLLACVFIGMWAAFSFSAKQNVGLLALAAALVAVGLTISNRRRALLQGGFIMIGFVGTALLVLAPVVMSGALAALRDDGLAGKGAYLRLGAVDYFASLGGWLGQARGLPTLTAAMGFTHGLVLVLPIGVGLVGGWQWRQLDRANRVLLVFAVAAVATAFPRWDRFHMAYAVPVLLVTVSSLLRGTRPSEAGHHRSVPFNRLAAAVLFGLAVAGPLAAPAGIRALRPSTLPHFRGPLVSVDTERYLAESAHALADAAEGRPMFVLGADAGFLYLASGLRNPTPFDIPIATSVGRYGATALLAQLASGRLSQVCVHHGTGHLDLVEAATFIEEHLQKGPDVGPCTVYRGRGTNAGQQGESQ